MTTNQMRAVFGIPPYVLMPIGGMDAAAIRQAASVYPLTAGGIVRALAAISAAVIPNLIASGSVVDSLFAIAVVMHSIEALEAAVNQSMHADGDVMQSLNADGRVE